MSASRELTDERLLADLMREVRPLLTAIHAAVGDPAAPGWQSPAQFLDTAPVAQCLQLAGVWNGAAAIGLDTDRVLTRLDPGEQILLEIVAELYAPPPPSSANLPSLDSLLNDSGAVRHPPARRI